VDDERTRELADNLALVRRRLTGACEAAGRAPGDVTLVGITKTYPAADVVRLGGLGLADVGENRDQEASAKAAAVREAGTDVRWHFVGQLQRNKCRSVAGYADVVHSVDSVRLAEALADAALRVRDGRPLEVLVQVSLDGDPHRGGADDEVLAVADAVAKSELLRLRGVMAVAPLGAEPDGAFARLAEISAGLRTAHPGADRISAGMSGDLEAAVRHGSTHVRVGTALLGNRPALR
jgi:pyridoxal phosphate enzyme (YggS family)